MAWCRRQKNIGFLLPAQVSAERLECGVNFRVAIRAAGPPTRGALPLARFHRSGACENHCMGPFPEGGDLRHRGKLTGIIAPGCQLQMLNWILALSRRQFLATSVLGATSLAAAGVGSLYRDTTDVKATRLEIRLQRLPSSLDGLRIVQLSDFHYDRYVDARVINSAVRTANQLQPDLVVLTGDFVTQGRYSGHHDPPAARNAEPCSQILAGLRPRLGTFAVLGNHDYFTDPDLVAEILRGRGFHVLRNQSFPIEVDSTRLWIAGVNDVVAGADDLDLALRDVPYSEAVVLLAHEPDFADRVPPHSVDLQLSGHSHGGQIVLPITGPPYLPPLARKYPWGLRRVGSLTLYTNRGIGTIILPVRFNCPPEVTLFTLRAA